MAAKKPQRGNPLLFFRADPALIEAARQQAQAEEITISALLREALAARVAEPHEEAPAA